MARPEANEARNTSNDCPLLFVAFPAVPFKALPRDIGDDDGEAGEDMLLEENEGLRTRTSSKIQLLMSVGVCLDDHRSRLSSVAS